MDVLNDTWTPQTAKQRVLSAKARLYGRPKSKVGEQPKIKPQKLIFVSDIIDAACQVFEVPKVHMLSQTKQKTMVDARHAVMYLARKHTVRSYPEIAKLLNRKDHTTSLHGDKKVGKALANNDKFWTLRIQKIEGIIL